MLFQNTCYSLVINVIFTEVFELDDELSSLTRDTQNDGSLSEEYT